MRTHTKAASILAVVAASTVGLPAATANADTPRGTLIVCNESSHFELEHVYADGPSWRSWGSLTDECTEWPRVRTGHYDVGFSLEDAIDEIEDCPPPVGQAPPQCDEIDEFRITVKVYRAGTVAKKNLISNGLVNVATNVQRYKTTKMKFNVQALGPAIGF